MRSAAWCVVLFLWPTAVEVSAHGGGFVAPPAPPSLPTAPTVPTGPREPARPNAGNPGAPGAPGVPGITGRGGFGRRAAGRTGLTPGVTNQSWEFWWQHNREPYLPRHHGAWQVPSRPVAFLAGRSTKPTSGPGRFLPGEVRKTILPVLLGVLGDSYPEVVDSAIIAMARATPAAESGPFLASFAGALVHRQRSVREAAILGLGILGSEDAAEMLRAIVRDDRVGRQLLGETASLDDRHRAMAALALGLADEAASIPVLLDIVRSPKSTRQLASSAVLALGIHRSRAHEVVTELGQMLVSKSLDREVRAQVPIALQRLPRGIARSQLSTLLKALDDPKSPVVLRRSVAIALGRLGNPGDADVAAKLGRAVEKDSDVMTRNFSCIALGRMAERADWSEGSAGPLRDYCESAARVLVGQLRSSSNQRVQPYAALALGLMLRAEGFQGDDDAKMGSLRSSLISRLRTFFLRESNPSLQAAAAIALGLCADPEQAAVVRQRLRKTQNPAVVGSLAEALGMLGDVASVPLLRGLMEKRGRDEQFRISVARALGLLRDPGLQELLLQLLADAQSIPEASAMARGLGLSGTRTAAPPLLKVAADVKEQDLRRAFSIVALGLLAEKTALPWNVIYSVDANYTIPLAALQEVLLIL